MTIKLSKQEPVIPFEINGKKLGAFYQEIDGFYVYSDDGSPGYWDEIMLFKLLYELRQLNLEWETYTNTDPRIAPPLVEE